MGKKNKPVVQLISSSAEEVLTGDGLEGMTQKEADVVARILPALTAKIARESDARYGAEYRAKFEALTDANKKALEEAVDKIKEASKPLTNEEVATLLSQEYGTFPVRLAREGDSLELTIVELPAAAEKRLLLKLRDAVAPILKAISSEEWKSMLGASEVERLRGVIDLAPSVMDTLCECAAICLDPFNERPFITADWVQNHMGINRIMGIVTAQVMASRYRDFFSLASRLFQQSRMMSL